jgi:hypothetical protein
MAQTVKSVDSINFDADKEVIVPRKAPTEVRRVAELFGEKC